MLHSVHQGQKLTEVPKDYDVVTMGINPSKYHVHQGHQLTMFQAAKLLEARKDARGTLFVDDREFDLRKMVAPDARLWLPPAKVVESIRSEMEAFFAKAGEYLHDPSLAGRITIKPMSEYMLEKSAAQESAGFELYRAIYKYREKIAKTFGGSARPQRQSLFRPTCPDCEEGAVSAKPTVLTEAGMQSMCLNDDCARDGYDLDARSDNNYFYNYTVDPLRDVVIAERENAGVIHVFGGDYGIPWGGDKGTPKAKRIGDVANAMNPNIPLHHFVGPIMLKDGQKLSKSRGDATNGEPAFDLLQRIVEDGSPIVDVGTL